MRIMKHVYLNGINMFDTIMETTKYSTRSALYTALHRYSGDVIFRTCRLVPDCNTPPVLSNSKFVNLYIHVTDTGHHQHVKGLIHVHAPSADVPVTWFYHLQLFRVSENPKVNLILFGFLANNFAGPK